MVSILTRVTHSFCFIHLRGSYMIIMQTSAAIIGECLFDRIQVISKPYSQNTSSIRVKLLYLGINVGHLPRGTGSATNIFGSSSRVCEITRRKTTRCSQIINTPFPSIHISNTFTINQFHTAIIAYTAENVKSFYSVQTSFVGGASTASREGIMFPLR